MRILHTSDWHLGQKLLYFERDEEHRLALDWLLEKLVAERVDVLVVAGDIFDIGNPPNYARHTYYRFLSRLLQTPCRHVVITGGNHDSPTMLNAPRELLEALNIRIIGAATGQLEDELLELRNAQGQPEAVIAAVPFLRDRDLRTSIAAETFDEKLQRLREGIKQHYQQIGALAEPYRRLNVPILATGHLYAIGAQTEEKQNNIYIGDCENIDAADFPEIFSYVALGHIHRAQTIGDYQHVRYSGSLIPLSFSETKDDKTVYLLDYEGARLLNISALDVPVFRRLKTITGTLDEVKAKLTRFAAEHDRPLTPWVEVVVQSDNYLPGLDETLKEFCRPLPLELVKIRVNRHYASLGADEGAPLPDLDELSVDEVFFRRCKIALEITSEEKETLNKTFQELKEWMESRQEAAN